VCVCGGKTLYTGIGLMMAKALENNGAIVYIVSRRLEVLEAAAKKHSVRVISLPLVEPPNLDIETEPAH
jgi:short-subunit dehydrogenase